MHSLNISGIDKKMSETVRSKYSNRKELEQFKTNEEWCLSASESNISKVASKHFGSRGLEIKDYQTKDDVELITPLASYTPTQHTHCDKHIV